MMKPPDQTCDLQRINDYLDERLSDTLAGELEKHLCDCEGCRNELQKRSAEPDVWQDAVALLGLNSAPDPAQGARFHVNEGANSAEQTSDEPQSSRREQYVLSVLDSLAPTDDPEMLGRVGEYEISGVIGVGGMGAVLKGFDKSLRRVVAIKVMSPHLANSGSARTRFQREARAAAAITHDNVIDIYAVAEAAGLPYLVMPYARGPSLQKRIDEGGPLGVVEVVRIGRQIAAGLSAAHEQGLVHRDIKPANILLSDGIERLWITDFGVARAMDDASMTQTGVIAGTPQYMSPEQARGESVDHRSDLFSLGSVLYTACTGRPPFRSEAAYGILRRITDSEPRPIREINADIPEWLCVIIARLLAKHPADRFESAGEVADVLDGCLAHLRQPLQVELPPSLRTQPTKHSQLLTDGNNLSERPAQPAQQPLLKFPKRGLIMTGSILLAGLLGVLTMQLTNPSDISGHWTGDHWQHVSLASVGEASEWYSGTFVDAAGRRGALRLEWSRLQRRYNGRWKVGESEAGQITLRAGENGTLRGAVSVDAESQLAPDVPRLLEFAWQPATQEARQYFESQTVEPQRKPQLAGRQEAQPWARQAVSIKSPAQGVIVHIAEGIKLDAPVKKGYAIAEIDTTESVSNAERQQQLTMLVRKSEVVSSKIRASEKDLDAAKQIYSAIEAQIETLHTGIHLAAAGDKAGVDRPTALLQAQSNLDSALVALKKAQADVVRIEGEWKQSLEERRSLEGEIAGLQTKLQQLTRLRIIVPVSGKVTSIGAFRESEPINPGDVICEVTPDAAQPYASSESTNPAVDTTAPLPATTSAPTTTTALALEASPIGPLQSLSSFGPASELAKRLRESQARLASIASSMDACDAELTQCQDMLLSLRDKLSQTKDNDPMREKLTQQLYSTEVMKRAKEEEISSWHAEKKLASAKLAEAQHEQRTILQILQAKLSAAQRQFKLKQVSKERIELSHKEGKSTINELSQAEEALAEAESVLMQTELLVDFYTNIGRSDGEQKSQRP